MLLNQKAKGLDLKINKSIKPCWNLPSGPVVKGVWVQFLVREIGPHASGSKNK